jgi:hypothetical protein
MYHELSALLLVTFDVAGTAVFATSGALAAARPRQTPPERQGLFRGGEEFRFEVPAPGRYTVGCRAPRRFPEASPIAARHTLLQRAPSKSSKAMFQTIYNT